MARRSRRHRRRGARRLRRFRRSGRSFGRRRYSRSFRYSRRRSSRSRKRYRFGYHGKYKKSYSVSSGYLPPGYLRRTYNFTFTKMNFLQSNGNFPPTSSATNVYSGDWLPANFFDIDFHNLDDEGPNSFEHFWTSPINMYSVSNIGPVHARQFGYTTYTVIRLDWLGLARCQFSGYFPEVSKQIMEDFQKYGYWRPGRITVKLIPKFGKPPSFQMAPAGYAFQAQAPSYTTGAAYALVPNTTVAQRLPAVQTPSEIITGTSVNGVWATTSATKIEVEGHNVAIPQLTAQAQAPVSGSVVTSGEQIFYINKLAQRVVGYLIPSGYDTVWNYSEPNAYVQMYKSIFSSASEAPNPEWTSSFRSAGYKRQILSTRRSCKWSYKYSRYIGKVGVPFLGNTITYEGVRYVNNPWVLTRSYSGDTQTPYEAIHDPARLTWIRADYLKFGVSRAEDPNHPEPYHESRLPTVVYMPQFIPIDFCTVYIPGFSVSDIVNLYDIRFSYTCKFSSRVFDNQ